MRHRSYRQFCGLAVALDVLGERWTMLIVRDLLLGPRRYGDLLKGLPGISTDLLAERLRTLESAGAVTKRKLPPPASVTAYELTEIGRDLQPVVAQLATWGERLLPQAGTPGYRIEATWAIQSIANTYRGDLPDGIYELVVDERSYAITIDGEIASVVDGPPRRPPLLSMAATAPVFLALASRTITLDAARDQGMRIDDNSHLATQFIATITVPASPETHSSKRRSHRAKPTRATPRNKRTTT